MMRTLAPLRKCVTGVTARLRPCELQWARKRNHSELGVFMRKTSGKSLDREIFERQAAICKAFAHATRIHLLDLLGRGERPLSALQAGLKITKANLSQHLAILKGAGVVITRREGKQVYASLTLPEITQACHLIRRVLREQIRKQHRLAA